MTASQSEPVTRESMTDETHPPSFLSLPDGGRVAYRFLPGRTPTVVFLCGYASEMSGTKTRYLHGVCAEAGHAYLRFDYRGRGASSGRFEDGTIGSWTDDACAVIEAVTRGPLVLVGSSMGGWIMLLVARRLPERVRALVGVAAAPDFTEDGMWPRIPESEREMLATRGVIHVPSEYSDDPYPITLRLIEDGRERLQLRDRIPLDCPVRLIHGYRDEDVPWRTSLRLAARLRSSDVTVEIVGDGDHRLSRDEDLARLARTLHGVLGSWVPDRPAAGFGSRARPRPPAGNIVARQFPRRFGS